MLKDTYEKTVGIVEKLCAILSVMSIISMMLLITVDVTLRKAFNHPIPGGFEITEDYLMVGIVYMALSYIYLQGGHVRVTIFLGIIPKALKRPLDIILNLFSLGFFVLVAIGGMMTFLRAVSYGEFSSSILAYPLAPAYFLVPLGSILLCIRIIESIISPSKMKWEDI